MISDRTKDNINSMYKSYLREAKVKNTFICPLCGNGSGSDGDGLRINPKSNNPYYLKCFKGSCNFSGDLISLYQQEKGVNFVTAVKELSDRFNIILEEDSNKKSYAENKSSYAKTTQSNPNPGEAKKENFVSYFENCLNGMNNQAAINYLQSRGLSLDTAINFHIGYDEIKKRLIVPVSDYFYIARDITGTNKKRYDNPKGAIVDLFNKKALLTAEKEPIYIVEGTFDALAIEEVGYGAIALNGTPNKEKLVEFLKDNKGKGNIILSLDKDEEGQKVQKQIAEKLKEADIPFFIGDIIGEYKDPNEALVNDREGFKKRLFTAQAKATKPYNVLSYMLQGMNEDIEAYKQGKGIKTGFNNLDLKAGSLHAGLYILGANSSLGKTTFMHQMADQIAEQGTHVLYFSLEQSTLELVSKSISRCTAQINYDTAINSLEIRYGSSTEAVLNAKKDYIKAVGDRISIIEGNFACNITYIKQTIKDYIEQNNVAPVIFIDYLQIIPAEQAPSGRVPTDPRAIVDYNITELKKISRALNVPIFAISSLNRANYLQPIDYSSFKESGAIEFTADVIWGLQLACISQDIFYEGNIKEQRETIAREKSKLPRDIELVCLKNRYGISDYKTSFKYYPNYDLFLDAEAGQPIKSEEVPFKKGKSIIL